MSSTVVNLIAFIAPAIVFAIGWMKISKSVAAENAVELEEWERT